MTSMYLAFSRTGTQEHVEFRIFFKIYPLVLLDGMNFGASMVWVRVNDLRFLS